MKYVSTFSGIEAATEAWEPLGWEPLAFCEIEPFPSAVLAHRYPDVPNLGDMTQVDWSQFAGKADVFVGGSPCQAFSVAGLRKSMEDDRGNLTLEFVKAARAVGAAFTVWENVPGVLNTDDNAFGCFLAAIVGEDTPLIPAGGRWTDAGMVAGPEARAAWRVLDAQYFGLAQRRRRVFLVRCPLDGADPAQVLLEPESVRRHTPPSREQGEGVTAGAQDGAGAGGWPAEVAATLRHENGSPGYANQDIFSQKGANLVPALASGQANAEIREDGISPTLTCLHESPIVAFRKSARARSSDGYETWVDDGIANTLNCFDQGSERDTHAILQQGYAVRRLMPVECERLQGFSDDHTLIPWRKKAAEDCPDGPRYKTIGNSMAVAVMRWLGERIEAL